MNSAGFQPANLSLLHGNITWLAATSLPNKLHLQLFPMFSHLVTPAQGMASPWRVLSSAAPEQRYSLVFLIYHTTLARQHIFYLLFNQISTIYFPCSTGCKTNNSAVFHHAHTVHHKMWGVTIVTISESLYAGTVKEKWFNGAPTAQDCYTHY